MGKKEARDPILQEKTSWGYRLRTYPCASAKLSLLYIEADVTLTTDRPEIKVRFSGTPAGADMPPTEARTYLAGFQAVLGRATEIAANSTARKKKAPAKQPGRKSRA